MSTVCSNNTSALTFSPCVSLTFLLNVGIELTANQCQSVYVCIYVRVCVTLGIIGILLDVVSLQGNWALCD